MSQPILELVQKSLKGEALSFEQPVKMKKMKIAGPINRHFICVRSIKACYFLSENA